MVSVTVLPGFVFCSYLTWTLEDNVYRNHPHVVAELEGEITAAMESTSKETLTDFMENLSRRQ